MLVCRPFYFTLPKSFPCVIEFKIPTISSSNTILIIHSEEFLLTLYSLSSNVKATRVHSLCLIDLVCGVIEKPSLMIELRTRCYLVYMGIHHLSVNCFEFHSEETLHRPTLVPTFRISWSLSVEKTQWGFFYYLGNMGFGIVAHELLLLYKSAWIIISK